EDVDLAFEVGVRGGGAGGNHDLSALNILALGATQQQATVLAGPRLVHLLVEHLDTGDGGLLRLTDAEDLDVRVDVELAALDLAGDDGATTGDREDVLDGHEERLVHVAHGLGDVLVHGRHEIGNRLGP